MKKIYFLLLMISFSASSQVTLPYFQYFEDENFWSEPETFNNFSLQVATENIGEGTDVNASPCNSLNYIECYQQRISNARGYSWDISSNHNLYPNSHSLKLTVHDGDIPYMGGPSEGRTRSEISFSAPNEEAVYYKWELFVPDDNEFVETNIGEAYHINFQIKESSNTYPNIGTMSIQYSSVSNNKRDLFFYIIPPSIAKDYINGEISYLEYNSKWEELTITDGIEKGTWNNIVVKIKPSQFSNGYIEFWINGKPVTLDNVTTDSGPNLVWTHRFGSAKNTNDEPYKLYAENIYLDDNGNNIPYNIKFGSYRKPQTTTQSVYINSISITDEMPPFYPITTQLKSQYCDNILNNDYIIECNPVNNATNYKFRFTNGLKRYFIDSPTPMVNLSNYNIPFGATYQIDISTQGDSFEFDYGTLCNVTFPNKTSLINNDCNSTKFIGQTLTCHSLNGTTNYKFRFKNSQGQYTWIDNNEPTITIPNISFFQSGSYDVDIYGDGGTYAEVCNIQIYRFFVGRLTKGKDQSKAYISQETNIYPNPVNDILYLQNVENKKNIIITDMSGKTVMEKALGNENFINVEKLSSGQYILIIEGDLKKHKFIKK